MPLYRKQVTTVERPADQVKEYFEHIQKEFNLSERAIKLERAWNFVFIMLIIAAIILGLVFVVELEEIVLVPVIDAAEGIRDTVSILLLISIFVLPGVIFNAISKLINRRLDRRILPTNVRIFCYIYLAKRKLQEYRINSNVLHLKVAQKNFDLYSEEALLTWSNTIKEKVTLEEFKELCANYDWVSLNEETIILLNNFICIQRAFPIVIKTKEKMEELQSAIDWMVLHYHNRATSPSSSDSAYKNILLLEMKESVANLEQLVNSHEKGSNTLKSLTVAAAKNLYTAYKKYGVLRFVLGLLLFGGIGLLVTYLCQKQFGDNAILIGGIISFGGPGAMLMMQKKPN
jgi:hypothetical protein